MNFKESLSVEIVIATKKVYFKNLSKTLNFDPISKHFYVK
jgi:hypothetical protein